MTIALDYDGTFTSDPDFWRQFIALAKASGHRVICVTCRRDSIEGRQQIDEHLEPVAVRLYCTGGSPKRWFMEQAGIKVDIWIDDEPKTIERGR